MGISNGDLNGNFVRGICKGVLLEVCVCCFQKGLYKGILHRDFKWEL